jgi:hypothetical protein
MVALKVVASMDKKLTSAQHNKLTSAQHNKLAKDKQTKLDLRAKQKQDALNQRYYDHIEMLVNMFQTALKLQHWHFILEFDGRDDVSSYSFDEADRACIQPNTEYIQAHIGFAKPLQEEFNTGQYREVASAVLHELCHTFFIHFSKFPWLVGNTTITQATELQLLEERQTSHLTHAIIDLVPEFMLYPS